MSFLSQFLGSSGQKLIPVEILVIGGGGGGGGSNIHDGSGPPGTPYPANIYSYGGGGGGSGKLMYAKTFLNENVEFAVIVGGGGAGGIGSTAANSPFLSHGTPGSKSSFLNYEANGGGGGGKGAARYSAYSAPGYPLSPTMGSGGGSGALGYPTRAISEYGHFNDGSYLRQIRTDTGIVASTPGKYIAGSWSPSNQTLQGGGGGGSAEILESSMDTVQGVDGTSGIIIGFSNIFAGGGGGGSFNTLNTGGAGGGGGGAILSPTATSANSGSPGTGSGGGAGMGFTTGIPQANREIVMNGASGGGGTVIIRYPSDFDAATSVTGNTPTTPQPNYHVYRWNGTGTIRI